MKNLLLASFAMPLILSCQALSLPSENEVESPSKMGCLEVHFVESLTKAALPDTNEFFLSIVSGSGTSVFHGKFSTAPQNLLVTAGTYTVKAYSREFSTPLFDAPAYGDEQVVSVKSGQTASVILNCVQTNAGVKLNIAPEFLVDYPSGVLYLQGANGKLMYAYSEKRTAYFLPGSISLLMDEGGKSTTLFSRRVEAQQVLCVNVSSSSESSPSISTKGGIHIRVDTTRQWIYEDYTIGGSLKGASVENAMSVSQARTAAPLSDTWVYGYIVGGDLSSSKCSFEGPFVSRTNLVIASKSNCTEKELCLSVQLAKGDIRDEINLVDNEFLLGRKIYLRGDIVESYYGIPGLQCISEYSF